MITFNYVDAGDQKKPYVEGVCLSTDTKPTTGIVNGSKLMEIDTSTLYVFNEEGQEWIALE